ncbi:hypothetical protein [Umezawaea beigongshangensis]|nr:hypothetical protein [Umezawaea beigongshangensis]
MELEPLLDLAADLLAVESTADRSDEPHRALARFPLSPETPHRTAPNAR